MDYALPRIKVKSKRKRRKPPGPWFWWCLFWLSLAVFNIVNAVVLIGMYGPDVVTVILLGANCFLFKIWWGPFIREFEKWRDGD